MATIDELNKKLENRIILRCKGKKCSMRDGFFIWAEQREYYLNKKCLVCGSGLTQLNITKRKGEEKMDGCKTKVIKGNVEESILHNFNVICAERALPYLEAKYTEDNRPRNAIELKKAWLLGAASAEDLTKYMETFKGTNTWDVSKDMRFITSSCTISASETSYYLSAKFIAETKAESEVVRDIASEEVYYKIYDEKLYKYSYKETHWQLRTLISLLKGE